MKPTPRESTLCGMNNLQVILIGCLVRKLGGAVTITQADIDATAFTRMDETLNEVGEITFAMHEPQGRPS